MKIKKLVAVCVSSAVQVALLTKGSWKQQPLEGRREVESFSSRRGTSGGLL